MAVDGIGELRLIAGNLHWVPCCRF